MERAVCARRRAFVSSCFPADCNSPREAHQPYLLVIAGTASSHAQNYFPCEIATCSVGQTVCDTLRTGLIAWAPAVGCIVCCC